MATDDQLEVTGQASVSDLADEDVLINFCLQSKIAKPAIDELLKRGFDSLEALALVDGEDITTPKIPIGQRKLILHVAESLKHKPALPSAGVSSAEGTSTGTTEAIESTSNPSAVETTGGTFQSAVSAPVTTAGVRDSGTIDSTQSDVFQHMSQLLEEQRRLTTSSSDCNQPTQVSWNDPQIHLSSAAGKSAPNHLDICDFVQTCVEEEVLLGGQGDQQIIVKSGPKKPRLENLSLSQWSVANLAILYRLIGENKLQGTNLLDYLSYTTKIYQLVQRYSLISVLLYDREYRKLQASLNFRWGTDVQHLSNIHLQVRERPAAQNSQQKKTFPFKPVRNGQVKTDTPVCRNFNSQKGCSFLDCKFKHICIIPGCKQAHSALNHSHAK